MMKKVLAIILTVCLLCTSFAMTVSAANARATNHIFMVSVSAANVRRSASMSAEVIGNLVRGDTFNSNSGLTSTWFYGTAGTETSFYQEFGSTPGYVYKTNFGFE